MNAIGVRGESRELELLEVPKPVPEAGGALIKTLAVGIDGTDHEIIAGKHGRLPPNEEYLILGHEAVGTVVDSNQSKFSTGDIVVPTVRRPPDGEINEYFKRGEPDMAPPEQTVERGIDSAHGFMSEYFTSKDEFLVSVPEGLAKWAYLVEPLSIVEKALELAYASRSTFSWEPETILVLGDGPLGLLTIARLPDEKQIYCLGQGDLPNPKSEIVDRLGAQYVNSKSTSLDKFAEKYESPNFIFEATGCSKHPFQSINTLAPNGVTVVLGLPDSNVFEVDGGQLHSEIVMKNKAVVGSVNSRKKHFEAAVSNLDRYTMDRFKEYTACRKYDDDLNNIFTKRNGIFKSIIKFDKTFSQV